MIPDRVALVEDAQHAWGRRDRIGQAAIRNPRMEQIHGLVEVAAADRDGRLHDPNRRVLLARHAERIGLLRDRLRAARDRLSQRGRQIVAVHEQRHGRRTVL